MQIVSMELVSRGIWLNAMQTGPGEEEVPQPDGSGTPSEPPPAKSGM